MRSWSGYFYASAPSVSIPFVYLVLLACVEPPQHTLQFSPSKSAKGKFPAIRATTCKIFPLGVTVHLLGQLRSSNWKQRVCVVLTVA